MIDLYNVLVVANGAYHRTSSDLRTLAPAVAAWASLAVAAIEAASVIFIGARDVAVSSHLLVRRVDCGASYFVLRDGLA